MSNRLGGIVLPLLLLSSFLFAVPAMAGTQADPEITDDNDAALLDLIPVCAPTGETANGCAGPGGFTNIQSAWVASETDTEITVHIDGPNNPNSYGPTTFDFHFKVGEDAYTAGIHMDTSATGGPGVTLYGTGVVSPTGIASSAQFLSDLTPILMEVVIPRDAIGSPAAGTPLTEVHVTSVLDVMGLGVLTFHDRAPNDGFGRDYVLTTSSSGGGPAPEPEPEVPVDTDGDGVADADDICPGHDDAVDTDDDGTPDGCDTDDDPVDEDAGGSDDDADSDATEPVLPTVTHPDTDDEFGMDGEYADDLLENGDAYSYTFDEPGQFAYHCSVHPTMMGNIVVSSSVHATGPRTHVIEIVDNQTFRNNFTFIGGSSADEVGDPVTATKISKGDTVIWVNLHSQEHSVSVEDDSTATVDDTGDEPTEFTWDDAKALDVGKLWDYISDQFQEDRDTVQSNLEANPEYLAYSVAGVAGVSALALLALIARFPA